MKLGNVVRLVPVLALSACASILDGSSQNVTVKTMSSNKDIVGVQCSLTNDKGTWSIVSPGLVTVHRSYDPLNVKCESDGYIPNVGAVPSGTKGLAFGNFLFGGLIGAAVDVGTGSAYDYPNPIIINLQPTKATSLNAFNGS